MHNDFDRRVLLGAAGLASLAAFASKGSAGPLNPPAGAVNGTAKPLTDVEPRTAINAANTPGDATSIFKITQPGSYYLTANINGEFGKHGIAITVGGVTVDLCGFSVSSFQGAGSLDGVSVTVVNLMQICVLNGTVSGWGGMGVNVGSSTVASRAERILASNNLGNGINTGISSTVEACTSANNGGAGIVASTGSNVLACNTFANTGTGISTSSSCVVANCNAYVNAGIGISVGACCAVTACASFGNSLSGISTAAGCTITDCTARSNGTDGIACTSACTIRGNACSNNGTSAVSGAGIHVTSVQNRIEGNHCCQADRGIDVDTSGNFIVRNTCTANTTNWDVVAGNFCLVVQAASSAAITGNTGGVALGSTDPNANFTY